MLVAGSFADPVMDQETVTLTWDGRRPLLAELRSLGVNASPTRRAGLSAARWRERLAEVWPPSPDRTVAFAWSSKSSAAHAFRGAPRLRTGRRVSVEEMRARARSARDQGVNTEAAPGGSPGG